MTDIKLTYSQSQLLKDLQDFPDDYKSGNLQYLDHTTFNDALFLVAHGLIEPFYAHEPRVCKNEDLVKTQPKDPTDPKSVVDCEHFIQQGDKYFEKFVAPVLNDRNESVCFCCGQPLVGMMAALMGKGGFTWGLAHGEGFCATCRWPMRAHHFAKDTDGEELFTMRGVPLAYLPSLLHKQILELAEGQRAYDESVENSS